MSTLSKSITKRSEDEPAVPGPRVAGEVSANWNEPVRPFRAWLLEPTNASLIQFVRYGFVGGAAFACDAGTLWLVTSVAGLHYLISNLLGFLVGLLVNYWLSVRWVFAKRRFSNASVQFGLFASVGVLGVGINELVMWWLTDGVGWHYLASKLVATAVVYLWNFSVRKALIF